MKKTILITGATGLIGNSITNLLLTDGNFHVRWLTRKKTTASKVEQFVWDPLNGTIDSEALKNVSVIINLAGAGIADKLWTASRRKVLIDSRIKSVELLYQTCQKINHFPGVFISASAIGYYGNRPGEKIKENSSKGTGFVSDLCFKWEKTISLFEQHSRTITMRLGLVLSVNGGTFPVLKKVAKLPIIALPSNGKNHASWIHIADVTKFIHSAIHGNTFRGSYNLVSPQPVQFRDLLRFIIRYQAKKRLFVPIPSITVKILLGKMSEIFIADQLVLPQKLQNEEYIWSFPTLDEALENLKVN
ncbi:MAG: TIGR01777 family oxidoreductase [Bacteroidales bacterium]|nr:TIGR01777 family oxidoreductase [Bacteroidales bacterium]